MRLRRPLLLVFVLLLGSGSAAATTGGSSVTDALAIQAGKTEWGVVPKLTSADENSTGFGSANQYWKIRLMYGDVATLDWGVASGTGAFGLFEPGTTVYTISNASPSLTQTTGSNRHDHVWFVIHKGGWWLLDFCTSNFLDGCWGSYDAGSPGSYHFTLYVQHDVAFLLPRPKSIPLTTSITVGVHLENGQPITGSGLKLSLYATSHGVKTLLATAHPVDGKAKFAIRLSRALVGKSIALSVHAAGNGYRTVQSPTRVVKVE